MTAGRSAVGPSFPFGIQEDSYGIYGMTRFFCEQVTHSGLLNMVFTESKDRSSLEGLVAAAGFPSFLS